MVPPWFSATLVPAHTPVPIVPTVVRDEVTTPAASVVLVRVLASAVTVQAPPRVQVCPLTVTETPPGGLTVHDPAREQVTLLIVMILPAPVGVPVIAGLAIVGEAPKEVSEEAVTPAASVAPVRVPAAAAAVQLPPNVQVCPLTVVAVLTRSALVTRPVAVKAVVIVGESMVGAALCTTLPRVPVTPAC